MNQKMTLVTAAAILMLAEGWAMAAISNSPTSTSTTTTSSNTTINTPTPNTAPAAPGLTPPSGPGGANMNIQPYGTNTGEPAARPTAPGTTSGTGTFGLGLDAVNNGTRRNDTAPGRGTPNTGNAATTGQGTLRPGVGGAVVTPGGLANPNNVTASDQGRNAYDANVTRQIRERIMNAPVSMNSKNVSIITVNGEVVLRGQVDSINEQNTIESVAKEIVGSNKVRNETTVK